MNRLPVYRVGNTLIVELGTVEGVVIRNGIATIVTGQLYWEVTDMHKNISSVYKKAFNKDLTEWDGDLLNGKIRILHYPSFGDRHPIVGYIGDVFAHGLQYENKRNNIEMKLNRVR